MPQKLVAPESVAQATIEKLQAERHAYEAEAVFNELQSDRLKRLWSEEMSSVEHQRVYDFVTDVNEVTVYRAMRTLSEWSHRSKDPIVIRFNTPGGEYIPGMALFDYIDSLVTQGIEVTTVALGMAASFGAVLLQSGSNRLIGPNAWLMIHEVSAMSTGKLSEMMDETKWTDRAQDRMLDILSSRSKMNKTQIRNKWRRKDWWLDSEESLRYGFVDGIGTGV